MFNPYQRAELSFRKIKDLRSPGRNSYTYLAHDRQLDAEIVIKEMKKRAFQSVDDFYSESRILYASSHPFVAQVHYACEDSDKVYIAMPFYKNGSLKDLMEQRHLTVREIIKFGCQILSALHNIHSKGLIHLDIKPDNVLISDQYEALLSDFGQSKISDDDGLAQQDFLYNVHWPPEYLEVEELSKAADIYQFGLTLYRMCNGNEDFLEQFLTCNFREALSGGTFPDRKKFLPHIPLKLRNVIKNCLKIDPDQRYENATDVANAMASIEGPILDWQFAKSETMMVWTAMKEDMSYKLVLRSDGSCEMTKGRLDGAARRVKADCRDQVSFKEIETILGAI